ncbi:XRE family transcriptional regulator [Bradyrhizobium yuanmingense]|uniref:helix-turn-helix domain-containing protein n=1 Tax=Bradyrhizobium yuanmingense TaxID=108015 RepID=UPI000FE4398C|nr:helix-turn-helix transcriptional regulator [Bradyrhizobium yuanmingense]TGN75940.1 XRE family transcriptional regulator [Bradyrhizobium yuanmingense]
MPLSDLEIHPLEELKPPTDFSPDALRLWITEACRSLKITPTELARAAGVAPSTINKFMLSGGSNKSLSGRTMDTVVKAALRMHIDRIGRRQVQAIGSKNPAGAAVSIVRVGASVKKGAFAESHRWDSEELFHVSVLMPNKIPRPLLGFLMEDDQAGAALPYGTILVGAKVEPETDVAEAGDWFLVSQKDEAGRTEITVRKLAVSPNGDMWLISEEIGPDAYLGKTKPDGTATLSQNKSKFTLEYRIIVALRPMTSDFEGVNFHI